MEKVKPYEILPTTYRISEAELKIADAVENTHPQLTPLVVFTHVVVLAREMGLLIIAPKGTGKSTIIYALHNALRGITKIRLDGGFTPGYLGAEEGEEDRLALESGPCILTMDDITTMIITSVSSSSLQMLSQLTSHHFYEGKARGHPTLRNVDIVFIGAGTPEAITEVVRNGLFQSHVSDRFLRYYTTYLDFPKDASTGFYLFRKGVPKIPEVEYRPVPWDEMEWRVPNNEFARAVRVLRSQMLEARALNKTRRLLAAHAWFCGRTEVTANDARWLQTYNPCISIEQDFMHRPVVEDEEGFPYSSGGLRFASIYPEVIFYCAMSPQTARELHRDTRYSEETLYRVLEQLTEAEWLEKQGNRWTITGQFRAELHRLYATYRGEIGKQVLGRQVLERLRRLASLMTGGSG